MRKCSFIFLFFVSLKSFSSDMIIGAGVHPSSYNGTSAELVSLLKEYNIKSVRTDYPWENIEKEKGIYEAKNKKFEDFISYSYEEKISPLIILDYGNKLYEKKTLNNPKLRPTSKDSVSGFVNYAQWTVKHFGNKVDTYEIWNEWVQGAGRKNIVDSTNADSANTYAELVTKTCDTIKKIDPDKKIIIGSTSPSEPRELIWLIDVLKHKNVMECIDGISLHIYPSPNKKIYPQNTILSVMRFQFFIRNSLKLTNNIPLYITEIGIPSSASNVYSNDAIKDYFEYIVHKFRELDYIKGVWWYDFINDGTSKIKKEDNYGMLNHDKTPKPLGVILKEKINESKSINSTL